VDFRPFRLKSAGFSPKSPGSQASEARPQPKSVRIVAKTVRSVPPTPQPLFTTTTPELPATYWRSMASISRKASRTKPEDLTEEAATAEESGHVGETGEGTGTEEAAG
jgi:hypothetical protein